MSPAITRARTVKRKHLWLVVGLPVTFIVLEAISRCVLGLGNPPLSITHPTIEYMFKPNSTYKRFGNTYRVNAYGMRSDEMGSKREKEEVRILVLGDSVPNGGNLTDQHELATELIKKELEASLRVPVVIGNISAGTWSPQNLLAYLEEYGTFDAEVAVVVLNKGDLHDFPTFSPLNPNTHPVKRPATAIGELWSRYIFARLKKSFLKTRKSPDPEIAHDARKTCLPELQAITELLKRNHCQVFLLYHPSRDEIQPDGSPSPHEAFLLVKQFSEQHAISLLSLFERYGVGIAEGMPLFRDIYHPTAAGQTLIAQEILLALKETGLTGSWQDR